jgi:hypothetical protein
MAFWLVDRFLPGVCSGAFVFGLAYVKLHFEQKARHKDLKQHMTQLVNDTKESRGL